MSAVLVLANQTRARWRRWAWSLTCVRAHVSPQQPGSGEGLAAGGADAGQRVGADVHLERPHAAVLLGAVVAGV